MENIDTMAAAKDIDNTADHSFFPVTVYSGFYRNYYQFPAYKNKDGEILIAHFGLKKFAHEIMRQRSAENKVPVCYVYHAVDPSASHCVVDCTFSMGAYAVTETGESSLRTLRSDIARNYPYLEAQKRAFDRAVISFWQLELDGRRLHSDAEISS